MYKPAKQKDKRMKPKLSSTMLAAKKQAEMNWRKEQDCKPKKKC